MTVKEKIVEHAVRMFANSGIKAITMDDISKEAGISKRTIYENFRDKNELLCSCLDFMATKYDEEYERIESEADNMITMVFNFMKQGFRMSKTINPL
ncbi:MAG: TetR/AcrR family transcriptional regulator, partial [Bacteroidales bacterium]|nr:TetR/AcrR family transcriptional regulator [Bacteroidales bacterium]